MRRRMKQNRNEPDQGLGRSAAVRQRSGGSRLLGEHLRCAPIDGVGVSAKRGGHRVGHHLITDGSPDVVQNQAIGAVALPRLPKHDQAVVERANGTGDKRPMNDPCHCYWPLTSRGSASALKIAIKSISLHSQGTSSPRP